jgi:hypothetical protein
MRATPQIPRVRPHSRPSSVYLTAITLAGGVIEELIDQLRRRRVAADIVWPLVLAFMISLLFKPVQRILAQLHVPQLVSAFLIVLAVLGLVVGLATAISGPASTWAAKLPDGIPRLVERLRVTSGCDHYYTDTS